MTSVYARALFGYLENLVLVVVLVLGSKRPGYIEKFMRITSVIYSTTFNATK